MSETPPRRGLVLLAAFVPIFVAVALWLPRWWENREFREAEAIAGVEAPIMPGSLAEARKHLDPGTATEDVVARIGKPSMSVATEGKDSRREVWTYHFSDGTMRIHVTDGRVQRVAMTFGPPRIPTSSRPE